MVTHTEHLKEVWIVAGQQNNTRITMGTSETRHGKQKKNMPGDLEIHGAVMAFNDEW